MLHQQNPLADLVDFGLRRTHLVHCLKNGGGDCHLVEVAPTDLQIVPIHAQLRLHDSELAERFHDATCHFLVAATVECHGKVSLFAHWQPLPILGHGRECLFHHLIVARWQFLAREQRAHIHIRTESAVILLAHFLLLVPQFEHFAIVIGKRLFRHLIDVGII